MSAQGSAFQFVDRYGLLSRDASVKLGNPLHSVCAKSSRGTASSIPKPVL